MAGSGYKTFTAGQVLTAAEVQGYLQDQAVMVFDSAAARSSALGTLVAEGMVTYLKDTNAVEYYDSSSWNDVGDKAVASSIQNSIMEAQGDLITSSGSGVPVRLALGAEGQVLTSSGTSVTWQDAAGGGAATLLNGLGTFTVNLSAGDTYIDTNGLVTLDGQFVSGKGYVTLSSAVTAATVIGPTEWVRHINYSSDGLSYVSPTDNSIRQRMAKGWVYNGTPINAAAVNRLNQSFGTYTGADIYIDRGNTGNFGQDFRTAGFGQFVGWAEDYPMAFVGYATGTNPVLWIYDIETNSTQQVSVGNNGITTAAYDGTTYVAGQINGNYYSSPDASTWTYRGSMGTAVAHSRFVNGYAYIMTFRNPPTYGTLRVSQGGTGSYSTPAWVTATGTGIRSFDAYGTLAYAMTADGELRYTADGSTWVDITPSTNPSRQGGSKMVVTNEGHIVYYGYSTALSAYDTSWSFDNGTTWNAMGTGTFFYEAVSYGSGIVMFRNNGMYGLSTGITYDNYWKANGVPFTRAYGWGVANGRVVTVDGAAGNYQPLQVITGPAKVMTAITQTSAIEGN